jgi:hypothetical protein
MPTDNLSCACAESELVTGAPEDIQMLLYMCTCAALQILSFSHPFLIANQSLLVVQPFCSESIRL